MKSETYTEPCQTSKKDAFAKIVNSKNPLTSFTKYSNLDLWEGSEFTQGSDSYLKELQGNTSTMI